jgi:hypothetical protein
VTDLGKRRHRITDKAKKPLHYFKLPYDTLHFEFTLANVHKLLPYSFAYYNPYINAIPSPTKSIFASHLFRISKRKHWHNSKVMLQKKNSSQDLANCMEFPNDLMSPSGKCITMTFGEIDEEGEENEDQPYNSLQCIGEFSDKLWSKSGAMEVDTEADVSRVPRKTIISHALGLEYESSNTLNPSKGLSSCSIVTFSSVKKVAMPRRYIKWKKSSSYGAMSKQVSACSCSEPKLRSHKSKRHDYHQYNVIFSNDTVDTNLTDTKKTRRSSRTFSKALKQSSALFSKISEIVFPSTFKQYMQVTPYRVSQHGRKEDEIVTRQKYTPLPSPLPIPAKVARLGSDSECRVRMPQEQRNNNSQTQCGSLSNMHVQRFCGAKCKKDVKQTQKSLLVV